MTQSEMARQDARNRFAIEHWSEGYYDIDPQGELIVRPQGIDSDVGFRLTDLLQSCREQGLSEPLLMRFPGILKHRVNRLTESFRNAREDLGYQGGYRLIYPIKVNQQRTVVDSFASMAPEKMGLEAGSKAELLILLGAAPDGCTLVCNGFKDKEFVRLTLIGVAMGFDMHFVVESGADLELLIEALGEGVQAPIIGLRARLSSIGSGKWQNTGGERSKFGLTPSELVAAVQRLKDSGLTEQARMLHVHMGSQISHIRDLQQGMREVARFYSALRAAGLPVDTVDVGGGLAVDYDGTQSRGDCSANYEIDDYARAVVRALLDICEQDGWPHPRILSESGRALTAHHAILVTQPVKAERVSIAGEAMGRDDSDDQVVRELHTVLERLTLPPPTEVFHEADDLLALARDKFVLGLLPMEQLAKAEQLFNLICSRLRPLLLANNAAQLSLAERIDRKLADKVLCNFSVFRSLPDVWALDQVFPMVPVSGLLETEARPCVMGDLTCDSDGRIDRYVGRQGVESITWLSSETVSGRQPLCFFLVGAYQEILGDIHNLFGAPASVCFEFQGNELHLASESRGETIQVVHQKTGFTTEALLERIQRHPGLSERPDLKATLADITLSSSYLKPET